MTLGRPRTVMLSDDEMIKLGKEMVKWVKDNKPSHLSQWYVLEKGILRKEFKDHYKTCPAFHPYYDQAMTIIGRRYVECDGIHPGVAQRWQRIYYPDLMDQENEDVIFNARAKAEADKEALVNATPEQKEQLMSLLSVMSKAQTPSQRSTNSNNDKNV